MGLGKKTIDDQNYCGKKVLVRCDFNQIINSNKQKTYMLLNIRKNKDSIEKKTLFR